MANDTFTGGFSAGDILYEDNHLIAVNKRAGQLVQSDTAGEPGLEEMIKAFIKERDGKLDPLCVRDFCDFCGYTESEFWAIMDKFYNRDLFEKNDCGEWQLKHPIWEENK